MGDRATRSGCSRDRHSRARRTGPGHDRGIGFDGGAEHGRPPRDLARDEGLQGERTGFGLPGHCTTLFQDALRRARILARRAAARQIARVPEAEHPEQDQDDAP